MMAKTQTRTEEDSDRRAVSVRLPGTIVDMLWSMAEEGRRPFTTQMEIVLEAGFKSLGQKVVAR